MRIYSNKLIGMYKGVRPCAGCGFLIDAGNLCKDCINLERRIIRAGGPEAFARKHMKPVKRVKQRLRPDLATERTEPPLNILHRPRVKTPR